MAKISGVSEAYNTGDLYKTYLKSNNHELIADEPEELGGKNLGPSPGDYLCMSLASCKAITLRMYVQRKQWKVDSINVKASLVKGNHLASGVNTFYCEITVSGDINSDQEKRLAEIAKVCPVSRLLGKQNEVEISIVNKGNEAIT